MIGAIAIVAVTVSVALLSGRNGHAEPVRQSDERAQSTNQAVQAIPDSAEEPSSPTSGSEPAETSMFGGGLTVQAFLDLCDAESFSDAYVKEGDDLMFELQAQARELGYAIDGGDVISSQGTACIYASGTFDMSDMQAGGSFGVRINLNKEQFNIQLAERPESGGPSANVVNFDTDAIPTPEEAAEILVNNR